MALMLVMLARPRSDLAQVTEKVKEELGITDNWILAHRVDLHTTLRATATSGFNGKRAKIQLSSRVASVVSAHTSRFTSAD